MAVNNEERVEETFDVAGLFLEYLSHWKIFALCLVVALAGAYCIIRMTMPMYQVGASVYLNDDSAERSRSMTSMNPTEYMNEMTGVIDETEIEIMKSRNSLIKIVDTLQLAYSYYQKGTWRDTPLYKVNPIKAEMDSVYLNNMEGKLELEVKKDGEGLKVTVTDETDYEQTTTLETIPGTVETPKGAVTLSANGEAYANLNGTQLISICSPHTMAGKMAGKLDIQYAEKASTILNFTFDTPLPELGKDVLNMLIFFYNRQIMEDKNQAAIQTEKFIQARLIDVQNELREASNKVRDYEERKNIIDRQQQITTDLSKSASIQREIVELRTRLASLRDVLNVARAIEISTSMRQISLMPASTTNTAINTAIDKFNKDAQIYNRQRMDMTEQQDIIVNLASSLTSQRNQIVRSLEEGANQISQELQQKESIENRSNSQLASQPEVSMGYKAVKLDEEVKNNILTFLLQKREEIALEKNLVTPTAQFIDNPAVIKQVAPRSVFIYLMGLAVGLLLPALFIYMRRRYFPKFKDKEDLHRITKVPVIGEISKASRGDAQENKDIVVGEEVSTSSAELFRLLRNNITFARTHGDKKVILLTSSVSGEGKTFVAMNLAMTYAITGKKTLVIGLDIRRPVLAHKFGISNRVGITSYLAHQVNNVEELIHQSDINPDLYVMAAGPIPPNPNELLMSSRMEQLFEQLREMFDFIIVDTAPIGMVSDSLLIVPHSDVQLFVTRAAYSNRSSIKTLHEAINSGQLPCPYIVLNGVNTRSRAYNYHRYGNYKLSKTGYGYGYAVTNVEEEDEPGFFKRIFGRGRKKRQ